MATGETVPATCVVATDASGITMMLVDGADTPIPAVGNMSGPITIGTWFQLVLRTPQTPYLDYSFNNGGS